MIEKLATITDRADIEDVREIITAYCEPLRNKTKFFGKITEILHNLTYDNIFVLDEDYNCAMITHEGNLEEWITCPNCGGEAFLSEFKKECTDDCCREWFNDLEGEDNGSLF